MYMREKYKSKGTFSFRDFFIIFQIEFSIDDRNAIVCVFEVFSSFAANIR